MLTDLFVCTATLILAIVCRLQRNKIFTLVIYLLSKYFQLLGDLFGVVVVNFYLKSEWMDMFVLVQGMVYRSFVLKCLNVLQHLTAHNWQKWKKVFLTCPCHKIHRDEAVGLKSCKCTWKIMIFVKMWNLGQYRENLIFCQ